MVWRNILIPERDNLIKAIAELEEESYQRGLAVGINAIEKVHGWLTRQPDNEWQADVRRWVENLISNLKKV